MDETFDIHLNYIQPIVVSDYHHEEIIFDINQMTNKKLCFMIFIKA